jgi:hypothetical protein
MWINNVADVAGTQVEQWSRGFAPRRHSQPRGQNQPHGLATTWPRGKNWQFYFLLFFF